MRYLLLLLLAISVDKGIAENYVGNSFLGNDNRIQLMTSENLLDKYNVDIQNYLRKYGKHDIIDTQVKFEYSKEFKNKYGDYLLYLDKKVY